MSIGDETIAGVSQVRVSDLTLDGTDNGLRINSSSSHGGLVEDVVYDDICIRNAKNPVLFDTAFSFPGKGIHQVPVYRDITLRNVRISGGGRIQFNGFDDTHRVAVTLDGVYLLDGADRYRTRTIHADLTFGAAPVNLVLIGDDSTAINKPARGSLPGCTAKFVPFP
jgi:polygalacturonase